MHNKALHLLCAGCSRDGKFDYGERNILHSALVIIFIPLPPPNMVCQLSFHHGVFISLIICQEQ